MKIGLVTTVYNPGHVTDFPGINRYAVELTKALQSLSHEIHVFTPARVETVRLEERGGVRVVRIPDLGASIGRLSRVGQLNWLSLAITLRKNPSLTDDLDVLQTDIPLAFASRLGIPIVGFVHHVERIRRIRDVATVPSANAWLGLSIRALESVITPSSGTAWDLRRIFRVAPGKVTVIPHGVDLNKFHPSKTNGLGESVGKSRELLYVGSLDRRKRVDLLIDCLAAVRIKIPKARLVIVGDGRERERLRVRALNVGVGDSVRFMGRVDDEQLREIYLGCDLFVLPSAQEGFGFVLAEAMACGKPVIAFENPVTREVLGNAGRLVPDGRSDLLADGVVEILLNDVLSSDLAIRARRRAQALFDWRRIAAEYLRVYEAAAR